MNVPKNEEKTGIGTFSCLGLAIWHSLPEDVKKATNLVSFQLKKIGHLTAVHALIWKSFISGTCIKLIHTGLEIEIVGSRDFTVTLIILMLSRCYYRSWSKISYRNVIFIWLCIELHEGAIFRLSTYNLHKISEIADHDNANRITKRAISYIDIAILGRGNQSINQSLYFRICQVTYKNIAELLYSWKKTRNRTKYTFYKTSPNPKSYFNPNATYIKLVNIRTFRTNVRQEQKLIWFFWIICGSVSMIAGSWNSA